MFKTKKWLWLLLASGLVLILAFAGVWFYGAPSQVSAAEELASITQASALPGLLGEGYLAHGGPGGRGFGFKDSSIDYQQLLADALGITVEDLESAYEVARDAALEQAVADGRLTQEQVDQMKERGGLGGRGFGRFDFGRGGPNVAVDGAVDENALLADALGISVEDLQAARERANATALEQALEEGLITQEQVDEMQARKAVTDYIDREALVAEALGMTVEELQAAYDEGKCLPDLLDEAGLDMTTFSEAVQAAHEAALAQAVADGVITQEQADAMEIQGGMLGHRMMPGGPGGRMGMKDADGFAPCDPETDEECELPEFHGRGGRGERGGRGMPMCDSDAGEDCDASFPEHGFRGRFKENAPEDSDAEVTPASTDI